MYVLTRVSVELYCSKHHEHTAEQLRNRLWDAREAASFLKVSRSWIYARVERDEMPYIRVGGLIRFVPSQLRDWAFAKDRTRG